MKYQFSFILFFVWYMASAQQLSELYYAQPKELGYQTTLLPHDSGGFVIASQKEIYLFRKGNIMADTLKVSSKVSEQVLQIFWLNSNLLSVNTYYRGLIVKVENDRFRVIKEVQYDKNLFKELTQRFNQNFEKGSYCLLDSGLLNYQYNKKLIVIRNDELLEIDLSEIQIIENQLTWVVHGSNMVQIQGSNLFFWDKSINKIIVINTRKLEFKMIEPLYKSGEQMINEFYIDRFTGKHYLWSVFNNLNTKIYQIDLKENSYKLVRDDIKYYPGYVFRMRGIVDDKLYFTGSLEGSEAHFMTPLFEPAGFLELMDQLNVKD
jgi:hypothetical protein